MRPWVALLLIVGGCRDEAAHHRPGPLHTLTVAGSTAMVPLTTEAAIRYMKAHPGVVVQVSAGGSKVGLSLAAAGAITIGASDVAADFEQAKMLEDHRVAVVGFGVVSARGRWNQSIESLTAEQVKEIFVGNWKDWSRVGGATQPIVVINRAPSSGTRAVFGQIMLGGDHFVLGGVEAESSSVVQDLLLAQPGSIAYLGLPYGRPELRTFAIDGVAPTVENIEGGHYPLWAFEHLYTRRPPDDETQRFLDYVMSAEFQEELPRLGFIPVNRMRPPAHDPRK
jgi:phosphate transport system substrate-binding protein